MPTQKTEGWGRYKKPRTKIKTPELMDASQTRPCRHPIQPKLLCFFFHTVLSSANAHANKQRASPN